MHELKSALLIYEHQRESAFVEERPIIVHHPASVDGNGVHLGQPSVITGSFLEELTRLNGRATLCLLHPRIVAIASNHNHVAWVRDPAAATLFFTTGDQAVNAQSGATIPLPRLIFRASRAHRGWSLSVCAVADDQPLHRKTKLGFAPLYHVSGDGRVCFGSTTPTPADTPLDELPDLMERHFFSSAFTHTSYHQIHAYKGSYAELLRAARKAKRFAPAWIAPMRSTLGDFLDTAC